MPIQVPGFAGGMFTIGGGMPPYGTPPYVPPAGVPTTSAGTIFSAPSSSAGAMPPTAMERLGGVFGVPQNGQPPGLFAGDPEAARRRALLAASAQMMASAGHSTQRKSAGQILGESYLAGQKATDQYQQDSQRQAYLQSLEQQQRMEMEKQQRLQRLEEQRARTMANARFNPEALEAKAGELYAAGDLAGAEGLIDQAMKIRNYQVAKQNADTNASIAARGQGTQYDFHNTPTGMYRVDPKTGQAERIASWDQFNPSTSKKDKEEVLTPEEERQKAVLGRRIADSVAFFEGQKGAVPALDNLWDRSVGRAFGSQDYQERRNMDMIIKQQVLQMAKFLRPVSNDEVKFLLSTMPLETDPPDVQVRWLRQAAEVAGIQLPQDKGGSVAAEFGLERPPGQTPGASGSF